MQQFPVSVNLPDFQAQTIFWIIMNKNIPRTFNNKNFPRYYQIILDNSYTNLYLSQQHTWAPIDPVYFSKNEQMGNYWFTFFLLIFFLFYHLLPLLPFYSHNWVLKIIKSCSVELLETYRAPAPQYTVYRHFLFQWG